MLLVLLLQKLLVLVLGLGLLLLLLLLQASLIVFRRSGHDVVVELLKPIGSSRELFGLL